MSEVLVDSNILLDVLTQDATWYEWSSNALAEHAERSVLLLDPIVYAEVSVYFDRVEDLEEPLPDFYIGAHAAVRGASLLTRDARRYRSYFPSLDVIAPN